jgi:hypothetical protein
MIFEIIISITLLYLYLLIQILNIHYHNIDKDNNILYNNIIKYIKDVQILFLEIDNVKQTNNKLLERRINNIYNDIKYIQEICNEHSYIIKNAKI